MSNYTQNPNDLGAFGEALREQFPGLIDIAFEGEVNQTGDEDLMTFHEYGWRIYLDNGASFNIVITQHDLADEPEWDGGSTIATAEGVIIAEQRHTTI